MPHNNDLGILRELARQYADIAAKPVQGEPDRLRRWVELVRDVSEQYA